jgi:tRNA G18 (ribose-2'-O)-methylase SpoU
MSIRVLSSSKLLARNGATILTTVLVTSRRCVTHKIVQKREKLAAEASVVHQAFATARLTPQLEPKVNTTQKKRATIVLDDLNQSFPLTASVSVSGQQLWNASKIAREKSELRESNKVFVTGGASTIRRLWRKYRIQPNVVFVPDNAAAVPAWCFEQDLPSVIVRASPVDINRQLLSAELNDGYAAEFPLPVPAPLELATQKPEEHLATRMPPTKLKSVLVLYRVMVPSNVGTLIRAAVDRGYDAVVLCGCADPYSEKVVRASDGCVMAPGLKLFHIPDASTAVPIIQQIATAHDLLPIFGVPTEQSGAESPFTVAKKFHELNRKYPDRTLGSMVVLGSESMGLDALENDWTMPFQAVSIPMTNHFVDSINVAVAGSILLHQFRPAAMAEFDRLAEVHQKHSQPKLTAGDAQTNGEIDASTQQPKPSGLL